MKNMGLKELKKDLIIDSALNLFLEKNLSSVTIKDIALNIEVGEATIYRYFENKENIVILCAEKLEKKVYKEYFNLDKFNNGFEKIKEFYMNYLYIFIKHPSYYRFINEFDAFMLSKSGFDLNEYANIIDKFKDLFISAYNDGIKDNSIKEVNDIETIYYASSKALLELCKKESITVDIVRQDSLVNKKELISKLIDIILLTFKKEVC
jgi:AcrR family transcriptional regulator